MKASISSSREPVRHLASLATPCPTSDCDPSILVRRSLTALRIPGAPPVIDGRLDEPVWQQAPVATGFVVNTPRPGAPASLRSEARVLVDGEAIYIGLTYFDPEPATIHAPLAPAGRRDGLRLGVRRDRQPPRPPVGLLLRGQPARRAGGRPVERRHRLRPVVERRLGGRRPRRRPRLDGGGAHPLLPARLQPAAGLAAASWCGGSTSTATARATASPRTGRRATPAWGASSRTSTTCACRRRRASAASR